MAEITLVDFFSFFYRASLVRFTQQLSIGDETTGILFSLYRSYNYIINNFENVILCIDGRIAKSIRKSQFGQYKQNREKQRQQYKDMDLYKWKDIFLSTVPYYYTTNELYEGDDIIAALTDYILRNKKNITINILTIDTDLWQLIDEDFRLVKVYDLKHKYQLVDRDFFTERFNGLVSPKLVAVYKAIFGDPSDNIPSSLKPRTRKKPIIDRINELYQSGNHSPESILRTIYNDFNDKMNVNSLEELLAKYELIKLYINLSVLPIKFSEGDKHKYIETCEKYRFQRVPTFDDMYESLKRKTGSLKLLLPVENEKSEVDELF